MASTIKLKNGSGAPTSGQLVQGEPALDLTNKRLYTENASGTVIEVGTNPSSLTIGGTALTATAAELNTLDGITATTAELNTLDGITATVTELNYTDGVTSNIQTQLDAKAPIASPTFTGTVTAPAVNVNGTVTADGLTVDGNALVKGTLGNLKVIRSFDTIGGQAASVLQLGAVNNAVDVAPIYLWGTVDTDGSAVDFQVKFDSTATTALKINSGGDFSLYEDTGTTAKFFWDASAESLGIGTSSPAQKLHLSSTGNTFARIDGGAASTTGVLFDSGDGAVYYDASSNFMRFDTLGTERMRIDSSGDLRVGTTTSVITSAERAALVGSSGISVQSTGGASSHAGAFWNNASSGDNLLLSFYTDGGALRGSIDYNRAGGLTRYNITSDYRAKDILGPVENAGATIDALKVYEGVMKGATQSRPMLIAHEAQEQAPYAVSGTKDAVNEDGTPDYQKIDHSSLVPLLIAEIQSLRARVAQLEGVN